MATREKLRNIILSKVKKLSDDKLRNLDVYLNDLESHLNTERSSMSFSGIFEGLELDELTTELYKSRQVNSERIPKF